LCGTGTAENRRGAWKTQNVERGSSVSTRPYSFQKEIQEKFQGNELLKRDTGESLVDKFLEKHYCIEFI